jgi:hypothetical protein
MSTMRQARSSFAVGAASAGVSLLLVGCGPTAVADTGPRSRGKGGTIGGDASVGMAMAREGQPTGE